MSRSTPNHSEDTQGYIAGLSAERLSYPEPYLYKLLLDVQKVEDTAERRRQFKRLLVGRQMKEGIAPPQVDQKELADLMDPEDPVLRVERSQNLLALLEKHLQEKQDFAEAQRLAVLELFHREAPLRQAETDRVYFENPELVRADLEALAVAASEKAGKLVQAKDLNTNHFNTSFALSTGEFLSAGSYLSRATVALCKAKNSREASRFHKEILLLLKQTAGYEVAEYFPTEAYFNDAIKVRTDLEALAITASEKTGTIIDPKDLNMGHVMILFTLTTGQSMIASTYLGHAANSLGKAKNRKEAEGMRKEILTLLKRTAGFEVAAFQKYPPLDETYFSDSSKVKTDLEALAAVVTEKVGETIQAKDLHSGHKHFSFTLTTGESIIGMTYLNRAAMVLGRAKDCMESRGIHKETLNYLKRAAGFNVMEYLPLDEAYFSDPAKVRTDLEAIAAAVSKKIGETINPKNLSIYRIRIPFTLTTGESISGHTYLNRAARALGKAEDDRGAQRSRRNTLILLKKTAGLEAVSTDEAYFKDSTKVLTDLEAFAAAVSKKTGKPIDPEDLNTGHLSFSFTLTTGEALGGQAYLCRAAKALGKAESSKEVVGRQKEILILLKQIAGFEVKEYAPLDETYFNDHVKVRTDLEALAAAASDKVGKTIQLKDLNLGSHSRTHFTLTTSESVAGNTYLNRAAVALGKVKDHKEARKMRKEILTLLKKTAGFTTE